jgi:hypothetical protein
MNAGLIDRTITNVERAASALFGGAVGYAAYAGLSGMVLLPELAICAAAAAIAGHLVSSHVLRATAARTLRFKVPIFRPEEPIFRPEEIESAHWDELMLTDADRLEPAGELILTNAEQLHARSDDDLVLDDVLAELGPDSRVVRLFDRKAMPTPGQLKARIDDHLDQGAQPAALSDASQALSDALAELRRSLR